MIPCYCRRVPQTLWRIVQVKQKLGLFCAVPLQSVFSAVMCLPALIGPKGVIAVRSDEAWDTGEVALTFWVRAGYLNLAD